MKKVDIYCGRDPRQIQVGPSLYLFASAYPFAQACSVKPGLDIFALQPPGSYTPAHFAWQISRSND
jgi:hypothetical protein